MKKNRYTEEQIIGILKQHEAKVKTADLCREHGISAATFYGWKSKYYFTRTCRIEYEREMIGTYGIGAFHTCARASHAIQVGATRIGRGGIGRVAGTAAYTGLWHGRGRSPACVNWIGSLSAV
jgi:hypothetical protein